MISPSANRPSLGMPCTRLFFVNLIWCGLIFMCPPLPPERSCGCSNCPYPADPAALRDSLTYEVATYAIYVCEVVAVSAEVVDVWR